MRTTQAARYARWSVTVAAMVAVMVAGVYAWRVWEARQAQALAPPPVPPAVQQRSAEFTFSKVVGNDTRFILRAAQATEFKEGGRALLEDVWITAFGGNGARSDQLRTRACEYLASSGMVTCPEEVLIDLYARPKGSEPITGDQTTSDQELRGVHVVTSQLSFHRETGMATSSAPVQFRFPEGEGRAVGLAYDSQRGELRLLHQVELVFRAGQPGESSPPLADAPMTISSGQLIYRRDEGLIYLNGAASLHNGRQELQAGQITLELDAASRARRLVARDHPVFRNPSGLSDISLAADELTAPLDEMGRLARVLASGHVVLSALRGDGRHVLTASSSTLDFLPMSQAAGHFSATENVTVRSSLADGSMRRLQTSQLEVYFTPEGEADSRIERTTAAAATMEWDQSSREASRADAETMRLTGDLLDGSFDTAGQLRELRASGGAEVRRQSADGVMTSASRELLARIAPDGEWSTVDQSGEVRLQDAGGNARGERARFDRAAGSVTLTGSVVLTDESSQTRARTMTFRQSLGELSAEGDVTTTELAKSARGAASGGRFEPAHISSARMLADTATGRAVYSGRARLWQGASIIEADTIDLDRPKSTLIATGNASAVFPQARQTSGGASQPDFWRAGANQLVYEEGQHQVRLEGKAHARSSTGSMQADRMDVFLTPRSGKPAPAARASGFGASLGDQQVQRAQGFGGVRVESAGRVGTGERADYSAAEGKFVLSGGNPKLIDEFGNSTAGRQLTFYFSDDRIVVDSEEGLRTLTLHRVEK